MDLSLREVPLKSILKAAGSSSKSKMLQNISFSSDTTRFSAISAIIPNKIKDLKESIKYVYATTEIDQIFIDQSYDISDGRYIIEYNLPQEFQEMVDINLTGGLENMKINLNDLACLILFLSYHLNISNSPDKVICDAFYVKFIEVFSESSVTIKFIKKLFKKDEKRLAKSSVMEDLLSTAFSKGLYYTVEAFYSAFGSHCWRYFIRQSIKCKDFKLFKRFHALHPNYKPENILIWAIEYENVPVYEEIINLVTSFDAVIEKLKKEPSILNSVYFPGLADLLVKHEGNYFNFNQVLIDAISNGNHLLFKEMIKSNNFHFNESFNLIVINALRSIFWESIPSVNLNYFVNSKDFESVYRIIIQLQSNDPNIMRIFSSAIPDMIRCGFYGSALLIAVYMENRNYLKMLLNSGWKYTIPLENEGIVRYYGIWEFVLGAKNYNDIMKDLVSCNRFTILHAIGNYDLPEELWPEIIEKFRTHLSIEGEYSKFSKCAGFINDSNLQVFDLNTNKKWNLLDLAILNFNYTAVKFMLNSYEFSCEDLETSKRLAEKVKIWTESNSFYRDHLYPWVFGKVDAYVYGIQTNSHLFDADDTNLMNPVRILQLINSKMEGIIDLLNK
jgi:hypothetical protein